MSNRMYRNPSAERVTLYTVTAYSTYGISATFVNVVHIDNQRGMLVLEFIGHGVRRAEMDDIVYYDAVAQETIIDTGEHNE